MHIFLFIRFFLKKCVYCLFGFPARTVFIHAHPCTSAGAQTGSKGLSRQLLEAGDAMVALSRGQPGISPNCPPGTSRGWARGPGGHQPAGKAAAWHGCPAEHGSCPTPFTVVLNCTGTPPSPLSSTLYWWLPGVSISTPGVIPIIPSLMLALSPGSWWRALAFVVMSSFCFFPSI